MKNTITTTSKEEIDDCSDHDRSFERTRGSFIACINRSLEHAFEFLSETGYASGGLSDAERVDSRNDEDQDKERSREFLFEINDELRKSGISGAFLINENQAVGKQLADIDEDCQESTIVRMNKNAAKKEYEQEDVVDLRKSSKHVNKEASKNIRKEDGFECNQRERIVYQTEKGNLDETKEKKKDFLDGKARDQKRKLAYRSGEKKLSELDGKETMPYLTTERAIFKQMFSNAKESEKTKNNPRIKKYMSNPDIRSSPKKTNIVTKEVPRSPAKGKSAGQKGFKKFRESFRRKSSHFLPQKFAVQEEKGANEVADAIEFQYHCMKVSRDGNNQVYDSEDHVAKKKGLLGYFFDRNKKTKGKQKHFFRSSEMINQMRAHSRDNISPKAERPKSISLFMDKIRNQFDRHLDGSTASIVTDVRNEELNQNGRLLTTKESKFRRSESLRSIPSATGYDVASRVLRRNAQNSGAGSESIQILRSSHNRPMSTHDLLSRACSVDSDDDLNLHRVLKNRFSCCSIGDNAFTLKLSNHDQIEMKENNEAVFASSPRKDDDITEWIRDLQYSSKADERAKEFYKKVSSKREEKMADIYESMDYLNFLQQTRFVNGQIQTYL